MLEMIRRVGNGIRLVIAVVVLVPCLMIAGAFAAVQWWRGDGTLHVVPSPGESVAISIDGSGPEPLAPEQHWSRRLPQGTHHVVVSGPLGVSQMDVNVSSGFWSGVVPTSPSQCWAELEATHFYFGTARSLPTVLNRYPSSQAIDVGGDYLSEADLPASIDEHGTVRMLVPISCGLMTAPDAQLLDVLGYRF